MEELSIRAATIHDVPIILGFIRALARYEKLEHEAVASEEDLRTTLFGASPAAEVLLALHGATPVGFALFFSNYSTFLGRPGLHLEDLFVPEAWRGRGIGRALLARIAQLALERGCGRLEWAVLDWNEPAIVFYRKLGAQPMSDWTTFRLTGAVLAQLGTGTPPPPRFQP